MIKYGVEVFIYTYTKVGFQWVFFIPLKTGKYVVPEYLVSTSLFASDFENSFKYKNVDPHQTIRKQLKSGHPIAYVEAI